MMKLKKLLSLLLGAVMLCSVMPTSYAQGEAEVQTSLIIRPTVMINAGTESGYHPKFDYSAAGAEHALMRAGNYSYPNKAVKAGIFLRWQLPEVPAGYEVKRAYFIGGHRMTNQFKSDGYQNGSSYVYHLKGDIEEDFIYESDTTAYPDKNLATLIPTGNNAHAVTSKFRFKGTTTNYYDKVQDDTLFYSVGMSVKGYTQNLYKASNGKAIDLSTVMVSNQDLTFNGSKNLDYGPIVWYMEIDKLLDAEFVIPELIAAGKEFDTAIDVSILDERVASVIFNINGTNYTAALSDGNWTTSIPGLEAGEYTLKATITDIYDNVLEKKQNITVSVVSAPAITAEFVSKNYAHIDDGFGLALKVDADNVSEVSFTVEGTEHPAHLYNGNWVAYVPGIAKAGTYTITASVKDAESKTSETAQTFSVYDKSNIIGSTYCMKYQSSDGKMWKVSDTNNYDLKYDSTVKDCLYSIINISSITNSDLIESAYFVTSTGYNGIGGDQYTKFVIEDCAEFATNFFTGGQTPSAFPEIIALAAEGTYTKTVVNTGDIDYNFLTSKVPVKTNTKSRFIKIDATEYIKAKVANNAPNLYLRTSVRNADGGNYAIAINNAEVKLYIKYKDSETIDNYDGTTSYVVDARDYGENTVLSIAAKINGTYFDSVDSCNTATRILYRYTDGEENPSILVWNNITDIVPLREPIKVK